MKIKLYCLKQAVLACVLVAGAIVNTGCVTRTVHSKSEDRAATSDLLYEGQPLHKRAPLGTHAVAANTSAPATPAPTSGTNAAQATATNGTLTDVAERLDPDGRQTHAETKYVEKGFWLNPIDYWKSVFGGEKVKKPEEPPKPRVAVAPSNDWIEEKVDPYTGQHYAVVHHLVWKPGP